MTAVAPRLRLVQPRPVMGKVDAPYLTSRPGAKGSKRWYFQPRSCDRPHGWSALRLHDQYERPIADELEAAAACRALAEIYTRWRAGEEGYGPHRIDKLGRVVAEALPQSRKARRQAARGRHYKPGQIGAMVADYMGHDIFKSRSAKTQTDYESYLGLLVEHFGEDYWWKLAPGKVRRVLLKHAAENGPSGAHAAYRTWRAFLGKIRLCYDSVDHPGFVPENANPLASLDLGLVRSPVLIWPRAAVDAFVALADAEGQPSIGDAIVMMSWLGVRKQDWLDWPADAFDRDVVAFAQQKTAVPNVLPWRMVPALVERVAAAKARRPADAVASTRFFHDAQGRPWKDADAFRDAFNRLRDQLAAKQASFATRYYVGLVEGEPLAIPTARLTMRTMRHTCVTLNFDAGVPPHLIPGITGHSAEEIDDILAYYRARTADQAAAALQMRMDHEAKGGKG